MSLLSSIHPSSEDRSVRPAGRRPLIGLALGAGAARGWSHIGVLRALEAHGVVPDVIVGTSIGAVVGSCYAAGKLDALDAFARSLTRRRVFGLMDVSFSGTGLLGGGRLKARMQKELGDILFEDLPIRFAAVATEIGTGHEIWLTRGSVVEAVVASYALPGLFEPVQVGGRWLIDGALVNPVPVTTCRALGADIVIAVNLVADSLGRGTVIQESVTSAQSVMDAAPAPVTAQAGFLTGIWGSADYLRRAIKSPHAPGPNIAGVLIDAFNITQDRIARSRLAGDPPDVTISARVGKVGLFEFHRAAELIAVGEEAARRAMPDLRDHITLQPTAAR